jgi:AraC-like DNA-binding protein
VFEYVRRLRITEAKSRLAATDENLSEIARHTGFASLTVFSRNFTRETGMSPSEFRRQIAHQIG